MYKIIGADHQEYGPVSTEQIRQWVMEGRVNGLTQVLAEGAKEWKPLAAYPEFAEFAAAGPAPAVFPTAAAYSGPVLAEELLTRDYVVDIGSCLSRGWTLVTQNFGPMVGVSFLVIVAVMIINQGLGLISHGAVKDIVDAISHHGGNVTPEDIVLVFLTSILGMPIYTVMYGGLFKYYLKQIRREPATISDAFSGFGHSFGQLIVFGFVQGFLVMIASLFCLIPGIYLSVAWIFALPLIVDREMNFGEAMKLSRKVATKHWWMVFALMIVVGVISACGVFACCIGVFVSIPVAWVAMLYAYEDIFCRRTG